MRQTSPRPGRKPDRTHVDLILDTLEKGELIVEHKYSKLERRQKKIHSQAKVYQITDLGKELIDIVDSLDQYKKAYFDLKKPVDEYYTTWIEKKHNPIYFNRNSHDLDIIRNNTLKERGFTQKDLELYDNSAVGVTLLLRTLGSKILEIMIVRSAFMLHRFNVADITKKILIDRILVDAITFHISYLIENINKDLVEGGRYLDLYNDIGEYLMHQIPGSYRFPVLIHKEVKNAILSYLSLLKPPRKDVEYTYKEIKINLESSSPKEVKERMTCLLGAYEDYMSKSN